MTRESSRGLRAPALPNPAPHLQSHLSATTFRRISGRNVGSVPVSRAEGMTTPAKNRKRPRRVCKWKENGGWADENRRGQKWRGIREERRMGESMLLETQRGGEHDKAKSRVVRKKYSLTKRKWALLKSLNHYRKNGTGKINMPY